MIKNLGGMVSYPRRFLAAHTDLSRPRGGGCNSKFPPRWVLFCITAYSAAGLAGIFDGFNGIFAPSGSGLGTYALDSKAIQPSSAAADDWCRTRQYVLSTETYSFIPEDKLRNKLWPILLSYM